MKLTVIFLHLLVTVSCYELKQVLILGRHGIRSPLEEDLDKFSAYPLSKWNNSAGYLTEKGALIEEYIGQYIYKSLVRKKLLKEGCPDENSILIYANTLQRTLESAKAFVRGAFDSCNIAVTSMESRGKDPIFSSVIINDSRAVREPIVKEIQKKLRNLDVRRSYLELEDILDIKNSRICQIEGFCHFDNEGNVVYYKIGEIPDTIGPLSRAYVLVDSFLMGYYEGHAIDDVAWGRIQDTEQWKTLTQIIDENQNVRFNSKIMGRQIAKYLLGYIFFLVNESNPKKFISLHGHDGNLYSVMAAIGVKKFVLQEHYENIPISGKLVFQKWHDEAQNKNLLKMDFLYLTVDQLRDVSKISINNPPRSVQLFLNDCPIDSNGFCPWEVFIKIVNDASGF